MPNTFCNLLSNGYSFSADRATGLLQVSPCCLHKKKIPVDAHVMDHRREQFDSIQAWTPACDNCRLLEASGQQSLRKTGKDWIPADVPVQAAVMVDINLDIECNAACVICGDHNSSLWAKENQKFFKIHSSIENSRQKVNDHIDLILRTISLDHVTYVKFFGGEPLFTDTHLKFLEQIPYKENVIVHYTTNASIFPSDQILEMWSRFKTIIFAASIDGIEKQFDYVRWPLPWSKVSRNLMRMQDIGLHNVLFRIEFTANLLNTYYYDRLERWVEQHFKANKFGDITEINIHHCTENEFALENMPASVREMVIEKYGPVHVLSKMVSSLGPEPNLDRFWQFVNRWDSRRNQHWRECFPDLEPHIANK